MSKLWQKSAAEKLHPLVEAYTVGEDPVLDRELLPFDIEATRAHAKGLQAIGILTKRETEQLLQVLSAFEKEARAGRVIIGVQDEDCHTVIENHLTRKLGDIGKKIHAGRSRNDQVLVALRLFQRDRLAAIRKEALALAEAFLVRAEQYRGVPFPGYTHTQQAMLSSIGHYYGSFVESLLDDISLLQSVSKHIDRNPLGSAAGFGVSLPLDRKKTTRDLRFSELQVNSLYCQCSRGKFDSVFLESLVQIMMTLGRFAGDLLFFTSQECGYFSVDDSLVTGSSIMPQKRNLDGLEILRGNVSVVIGYQHMVQDIAKNLLSGYNRDLQLLKRPLIQSASIVFQSIGIAKLYLLGLLPNVETIERKISPGLFMADTAASLVKEKGIPFRDAYRLAKVQPIGKVDFRANIASKVSMGAPGNLCLSEYRKRISALKRRK